MVVGRDRTRKKRALAGVAGVALGLGLIPAIPREAAAYNLEGPGCRYDPKNDDDGLGIGFNSSNFNQAMRDSTVDAAARWNAKMVPQFTLVSYGSSTRDLRVEFGTLPSNVGAQTTFWCSASANHYTKDPLFTWNIAQGYYVSTGPHRTAIGVQEIGHSYGVAHNNSSSCDVKVGGLMYPDPVLKHDTCGWVDPTTDDVNGAVDAHNG